MVRAIDRSPDVIQLNAVCAIARSSTGSPTRRATAATDTANERMMAPHATAPEMPLLNRRAKLALTRNPTSGNSGISSSIEIRQQLNAELAEHAEPILFCGVRGFCVRTS